MLWQQGTIRLARFFLHCLEERAEGELPAAAVSRTQFGFFWHLWCPVILFARVLLSLSILNETTHITGHIIDSFIENTEILTLGAGSFCLEESHSFTICRREGMLIFGFFQTTHEQEKPIIHSCSDTFLKQSQHQAAPALSGDNRFVGQYDLVRLEFSLVWPPLVLLP